MPRGDGKIKIYGFYAETLGVSAFFILIFGIVFKGWWNNLKNMFLWEKYAGGGMKFGDFFRKKKRCADS